MSAKIIFTGDNVSPLMNGFLSDTFTGLYAAAHVTLDGAKDFASAIVDIGKNYEHNTEEANINAFLGFADDVIETITSRTVYMDSNIALTDGSKLAKDGARVIPNLYEAIDGLRLGEEILAKQTKDLISTVTNISDTHKPSTADTGLFVEYIASNGAGSNYYKPFLANVDKDNYVISPGIYDGKYVGNHNADEANTSANLHFKANEITFTVANQNATISNAYKLDAKPASTTFELEAEQLTQQGAVLMQKNNTLYYWVPLEDNDVDGDTTITNGSHGKIFAKGGDDAENLNGQTVVCYSHAVATADVTVTKVSGGLGVHDEMTYNLGAIIEAIQELNRRTMFMDIDMSFNGAMSYADYTTATIPSSKYGKLLDGLPAGSDGNLANHIPVVQGN